MGRGGICFHEAEFLPTKGKQTLSLNTNQRIIFLYSYTVSNYISWESICAYGGEHSTMPNKMVASAWYLNTLTIVSYSKVVRVFDRVKCNICTSTWILLRYNSKWSIVYGLTRRKLWLFPVTTKIGTTKVKLVKYKVMMGTTEWKWSNYWLTFEKLNTS